MNVRFEMLSANQLIHKKGLDPNGRAQRFHTMNISRRIGKYMPHLTGTLETKLKRLRSDTEIEITGPYAIYQYFGKKMVNSKTGKGPANIPGVGFRYPKGTILKTTEIPLEYTKTFNAQAGPFWDKRLKAAEGDAIAADLQRFIDRGR